MAFLKGILLFVEALCSLLLITVILMQKTRGEGLGMAFGADMGESLFGARAGNVLVKITIWLGIVFLVNTTFLAMLFARQDSSSVVDTVGAPIAGVPMAPAPVNGPAGGQGMAPGGMPQGTVQPGPVDGVPEDAVPPPAPVTPPPPMTAPPASVPASPATPDS